MKKEKLKAGPDGNSMSMDTFSNSNALPTSPSSQQKVASTMMDVDEWDLLNTNKTEYQKLMLKSMPILK